MGLFLSQSRGLFVRTWHYQRRQRGVNVCQFIVSPLLLVLLALLARVFREKPDGDIPAFATAVAGGWAAQFVRPDACTANLAALRAGLCRTAPFQPRPFVVPVLDATAEGGGGGAAPSSAVGSVHYEACSADTPQALLPACLAAGAGPNAPAANSSGLLGGWSLPSVYPGLLDAGPTGFNATQTSYDGVLLHGAFRGDRSDARYQALVEASRQDIVDTLYGTRSQGFTDRVAFYDLMYKAPRSNNAFPAYPTALAIDRYAGGGAVVGAPPPTDPITLDATVFYNISEVLEYNCTEECPIVAGISSLTDAVIKDTVGPTASASVYLRRFPETDSVSQNNFIELVVGIALALLFHFLLPGFLRMLVYERTTGLRQMMQMHGLRTAHYWVATYLGFYVQYFFAAVLLVAVGLASRIAFFTDNSPLAYVPLFFLWGHTMIALAMVLAPWFSSPETALIFGWFSVILISLMGGPYLGTLFASDADESLFNSVSILPSFAFMRAVYFAAAFNVGGQGITFSGGEYAGVSLGMCEGEGPFCTVFIFLVAQWAVLLVAGLYLDRVLPGAGTIREHPLFFLGVQRGAGWRVLPSQRRADAAAAAASAGVVKSSDVGMSESDEEAAVAGVSSPEPADVAEERARAAAAGDGTTGVVVRDLVKVFPGQPPKRAVDGLSLVIAQDSVFGLLGANGAGKSSTIAILTGLLSPTSGDVFINGTPISSDVRGIHRGLGVCPQHDVLWGTLTGEEHLVLYARLKGVEDVPAAVAAGLASVELTEAAKRQVMKYSGGMKRRLSVAIAFIGNPSIVLLDEPSAGLDPRSRYRLWECIQTHKAGKTVMLTTHSMEEAQRLCDRVGIIAGRLLAVGSPTALKLRLSSGYRLTASVPASRVAQLATLITSEFSSDAELLPDSLGGSVSYSLPRDVDLARVFNVMEASREEFQVRDWGVSQSSLEDVFVGITTAHARARGIVDLEVG
ncbi:hypothetical protein I4F81_008088 [Pyropia yezoensis]|uniref:Uncharacterized protein n=1 Tax=Pyropia yezoensis TaxID=2788 RepID=A0ACC3C622_PYRYE|nr:hypothetical protein I4F81_008088 [Neopyropia yezoensis]